MARPRKIIKAKEPVRIRERRLANGNISLYLDIYQKGIRKVESLGLYIVPGNDPISKNQNEQARAVAERVKAERILGLQEYGIKQWDRIKRSEMTLISWLEEYQADSFGISPSTVRGRKNMKDRVLEYLRIMGQESLSIADVDKDFCRGFLQYLTTAKRNNAKFQGGTINNGCALHIQTVFTGAMNKAVREGLIARNPMMSLDSREKFKKQESLREYLTIEEIQKVIDAPCAYEDVKRAFLFSCFCGLRLSDVSTLTWRMIQKSTDGQSLFVRTKMQKTQKYINVPLSDEAQRWLNHKDNMDEPIFHLPDPVNIEKHIKKWMDNAKIDKHITYHCSRHTCVTMLLTLGADIYTVSKILGHSKIETTQIYAKIIDQKRVDAVNLVDNLFKPKQ